MASEYEVVIREHHLDNFGHVNHAEYLRLLEEARWEMITKNGYGLKEVKRLGVGPVILEVTIRYARELDLRDRAKIVTRYLDPTKKMGRLEQTIFNGSGEICARASLCYGLMDLKTRKLIKPTERWLAALMSQK